MAYSEAQKEATSRYNKKAYDRIDLIVPKGKRRIIAEYAKSQGKSTNRFINEAIDKGQSNGGSWHLVCQLDYIILSGLQVHMSVDLGSG